MRWAVIGLRRVLDRSGRLAEDVLQNLAEGPASAALALEIRQMVVATKDLFCLCGSGLVSLWLWRCQAAVYSVEIFCSLAQLSGCGLKVVGYAWRAGIRSGDAHLFNSGKPFTNTGRGLNCKGAQHWKRAVFRNETPRSSGDAGETTTLGGRFA